MTSFSDSAFAKVLRWLARAVAQRPDWFIYPQLVLSTLAVLWTVHGLKLDMNRDNLVGSGMRYHEIYMRFQREFPGQGSELVTVVESGSQERSREFIERLARRVKQEPGLYSDLFYKADMRTLGRKALLLVPTNELQELQKTLIAYQPLIRQFATVTNLDALFGLINEQFRLAAVTQTQSPGAAAMVGALPFFQSIVLQARESLLRPGMPVPPEIEALFGGPKAQEDIYVTMENGRFYLLTVRPKTDALTSPAIEHLRADIQATQAEVPGVDVGLTGGPVLDYDEMQQSEHDSILASIVALVLCSAIFIVAYREVLHPMMTAFCLVIGLGYTMGFTTIAVGHLNVLTITFAPMLIGLAIDFGIHLITRFEEEMRKHRTAEESVRLAMVFTGQGIVTGGFTTAAAFLAMGLTNFKGIQEMGIISGGGLLLCLIPMMTTLPALLLKTRDHPRYHRPDSQRRVRLETLWLEYSTVVVLGTAVLCLAAITQAVGVYFDYDLLHMQSQHLPSVDYEKRLIRSGDRASLYAAVVADSEQQARNYARAVESLPEVARVDSSADLFPPDQSRRLALARSIKAVLKGLHFDPIDRKPVQPEKLSPTLWYLMGYLGLGAAAAQQQDPALARQMMDLRDSIGRFRVAMLSGHPDAARQLAAYQVAFLSELQNTFYTLEYQDTSGPLRPADLPSALRNRFIGITGKHLLQVYAKKDLWQHDTQRDFLQALATVIPPDRITGTPVQLYEYTTLLKNSYLQAAIYALGAIAIMVYLHFRSIAAVLLALLPVAIGALWLLGFMALTDIPFNPANIMTLPLVVGIGVTNGIQILNRFAEEHRPSILAKSTGKAVFVSGLTAIAGFGSLILARHQGIQSLGIVMSVGIAACMVAGLGCLPALLCLLMRKGWSAGSFFEEPRPARV